MSVPQGMRVTKDYKVSIGDHDFSDLPIQASGPIVERLTPGCENPLNIAWIPVLFTGDVIDEADAVRIVGEGDASRVKDGVPE